MIQQKPKCCRGTGKAIGFASCGQSKYLHKFGLCKACFFEWLYNTADGELFLYSTQIRAKKHVQKEQKKEQSVKKEETRQKKIDLMGVDKYRSEVLQPIFNEIARLIDYQCPCIATRLYDGKMNGGHFIAVGSNRTIALNLHNIHMQCFESNVHKGGDNNLYRQGLIDVYGEEYLDKVESLKRTPAIHLSKSDMIEIKKLASDIRNELKADLKHRTPEERIALREEINLRIGIYQ